MNPLPNPPLLPDDDHPKPQAFHRLLYHYIRAVQQQLELVPSPGLQQLIDQVDQTIRRPFPPAPTRRYPGSFVLFHSIHVDFRPMQPYAPIHPPASDRRRIQRNLDEKGSALLVVERANQANIMMVEAYDQFGNGLTPMNDRNRVRCTTFGNQAQQQAFNMDDIELYRSIDEPLHSLL